MGLSEPKNRSKLSADPNNTTWSRNTDRFGHRILTSQGWTPGAYLGAIDAAHAEHYTAANASHIRVFLKDDNLGLGAKRGKEAVERFGLGGFEGVLGRLNGKDETVLKEEQKKREDLEIKVFTSRRWGSMRFVSGGFLVGDKIERLVQGEKRKRGEEGDGESARPEKKVRRKQGKDDLAAAAVADASEEGLEADSKSKNKKEKKRRKQKESDADETPSESTTTTPTASDEKAEKKRRKAEKRALKEARRLKKAERKAAKAGSASISTTGTSTPSRAQSSSSEEDEAEEVKKLALPTTNPAYSMAGGRHAVRQRYIRQKKMASMDPRALREIFMVKTGA
ncbi:uncharacterized protein BDZ99DRAFT_508658 [Mytilinidion resinicola]|uniref:PinX1-related protein 1 n=1 Tax=Mytilinidion resinicola TaxID=574789 RepID=A0A6A6YQC5_9PEZI|nr:uncharacterized protein BDZ99DRAFT_508658 [Mytilinidion resinicola]KAF2810087.1 hypothetical protein BDZ99DRAFT_508658 [Mytilinidion resinicola]